MAYTERLLTHGNFLTRFAHGGRYRRTLELASDVRGGVAIDFGCGDAMILRRAQEAGIARSGYGVDSDPAMRESALANFAGIEGFRFVSPEELSAVVPPGSCDLALCTEALEHIPNPTSVLDQIVRCCRPGARVIITVPIEVGPSLLGKQIGRYFAGLRRPYGYEKYTMRELASAALLWNARAFDSSHVRDDVVMRGHKGFDFREIEAALRTRMTIEQTVYSPLPGFGPLLNSTVMWRCRNSPGPS
jgi:SAM-dependent methyltransferase